MASRQSLVLRGLTLAFFFSVQTGSAAAQQRVAGFDATAGREAVEGVLESLHRNASNADGEAYFALFASGSWFLGTDATERWTIEEFRAYAEPYFAQGRGWTYTLSEGRRQIEFSLDGTVAWFDEVLDNESLGECRDNSGKFFAVRLCFRRKPERTRW